MLYAYTSAGICDDLYIVVHQSVRLLEVIVTDILDSDHLLIMFSNLDSVRTSVALDPVKDITGNCLRTSPWTLVSKYQIHTFNGAVKVACNICSFIFYFWGLHPVASITTVFVGAVNRNSIFWNVFYYYFIPTTCFGPYVPSSGGMYTS
jgi:hypothetical protein